MLKENFSLIKNMFLYLRSDFYQLFWTIIDSELLSKIQLSK
jgi:hypothetical protein